METKKKRIGNDIRLAVDLRQFLGNEYLEERNVYSSSEPDFESIDQNPYVNKRYEVYYPNNGYGENSVDFKAEGTPISIRNVKAILVNIDKQKEYQEYLKKKSRFISRFPIEPGYDAYQPGAYDLCNSGYPTYRAYPHRPIYAGFGLHPHFWGLRKPLPMDDGCSFRAPVVATKLQNVVEVIFPARAQRFTGKYNLIIVAEVYCPGFNMANLKTVTVDIPEVIELVKTSAEGVDGDVTANVEDVIDIIGGYNTNSDVQPDVYVNSGSYSDNEIVLGRTDNTTVSIDTSEFTAWHEGD